MSGDVVLVPSIDFQNGRIVQLVQGERLALESIDLDRWIDLFRPFPLVQVIDLDAAMGRGDNGALVSRVTAVRPCQVGGGIRSIERARALLDEGAERVILGSTLFSPTGVDIDQARAFTDSLGPERLVAAIDARGGQVVIHGWQTRLPLAPVDAAIALTPFVGTFLYTHVDTEGTLSGLDLDPVRAVRQATPRRLMAAGGIRSTAEIERLDGLGIDAVVGMAIYTGQIDLARLIPASPSPGNTSRPEPV
ncbi:MAG TPA: HisA/HisF-related TIM barrel protein [Vicinamibacterales bacterium]|nr:HisA/HisF-related TIM barrel protein [Vicinamibacterales bacterium]